MWIFHPAMTTFHILGMQMKVICHSKGLGIRLQSKVLLFRPEQTGLPGFLNVNVLLLFQISVYFIFHFFPSCLFDPMFPVIPTNSPSIFGSKNKFILNEIFNLLFYSNIPFYFEVCQKSRHSESTPVKYFELKITPDSIIVILDYYQEFIGGILFAFIYVELCLLSIGFIYWDSISFQT